MKKRISILGCGWLGLPLAKSLITNGYDVQGSTTSEKKLTILSKAHITPHLIKLDVLYNNLASFLNVKILIINIPFFNSEAFEKLILLIEQSKVSKVIFVSSTSVYENSDLPITEESKLKNSPLAQIEKLLISNNNFKTTIIRFGGLIGYNRKPSNFFPKGTIIKNPNGVINMIHRDDCIKIIEEIINQNLWGEILNACADSHPLRRIFYTKAYQNSKKEVPTFAEDNVKIVKEISSKKLISLLNFKFKFPNIISCI